MRFILIGETSASDNFNCINKDLLNELRELKPQLDFSVIEEQFIQKLHLINNAVIAYNYVLKVFVIQKRFCLFDLINQEKTTRKLCISQQFNGMFIVRALNDMYKRRNYTPIYIFVDWPVTHGHYDNYYFSTCLKSAFIAHNEL